jgi:hypothetical protein
MLKYTDALLLLHATFTSRCHRSQVYQAGLHVSTKLVCHHQVPFINCNFTALHLLTLASMIIFRVFRQCLHSIGAVP